MANQVHIEASIYDWVQESKKFECLVVFMGTKFELDDQEMPLIIFGTPDENGTSLIEEEDVAWAQNACPISIVSSASDSHLLNFLEGHK